MGYLKRISILKQLRQGFSSDGTVVSGIVRLERYNGRLTAEVSIVNLATPSTGRYIAVFTDAKGNSLYGEASAGGCSFKSDAPFFLEEGFCVLVCFVKEDVTAIACAIFGENIYNINEILRLAKQREKAGILPDSNYADERVAAENYFLWEKENEPKPTESAPDAGDHPTEEKTENQAQRVSSDADAHAPLACAEDGQKLFSLTDEGDCYYQSVKPELDALFSENERESALEAAIPDSEWVKVPCEGKKPYAVGILKNGDKVRYILYGVPACYADSDGNFTERSTFVPISPFPSEHDGYRVLFQDAETGACIPVNSL